MNFFLTNKNSEFKIPTESSYLPFIYSECSVKTDYYYSYVLDKPYDSNGNKFYQGLPDSIFVDTGNQNGTIFLQAIYELNKGTMVKNEIYYLLRIGETQDDKFSVTQSTYNNEGKLDGSQKTFYLKTGAMTEKIYSNGKLKAEPPQTTGKFVPWYPNIYKKYELKTVGIKEGFIDKDGVSKEKSNKKPEEAKDNKEKKKKKISLGGILNEIKDLGEQ